ncbi:LysE family transporter [Paenibacillus aurantiacus]|uniref:LysE family transporter n=1 Tax=Paenibacillus aurantiacus TaxID=1936118 RepID=A0ABV5KST6_9BACL
MVSGLGAATVDALYGFIAVFGLTLTSKFLMDRMGWLQLLSGAIFLLLGLVKLGMFRAIRRGNSTLFIPYLSVVLLTLSQSMAISSLSSVRAPHNELSSLLLVIGVFIGSLLWWMLLSTIADYFRSHVSLLALRWANRISGALLIVFGIAAIAFSMSGLIM